MPVDNFSNHQGGLTAPAEAAEAVVPSDSATLEFVSRALYVGGGGDVALTLKSGTTVVLRNLQAGVVYPVRVTKVLATGTTASDIVSLR